VHASVHEVWIQHGTYMGNIATVPQRLSALSARASTPPGVLDASLPDTHIAPLSTPTFLLGAGREQWSDMECRLWTHLQGAKLAVNLKRAEHLTPSDAVWLARGAIKTGNMGADRAIATIRDHIAAFLDTTLRGRGVELSPSPASYDVQIWKQNEALTDCF